MRTTLTLDDDVAMQLAEAARRSRQPFKTVVNEALRRGLGDDADEPPFRIRAHDGNMHPEIDDRRLNELALQLEDERLLRKAKPPRK